MTASQTTALGNQTKTQGLLALIPLMTGRYLLLFFTVLSGVVAQGGNLAGLAAGGWLVGSVLNGAKPNELIPGFLLLGGLALLTALARGWQAHVSHAFAFSLIETLQVGIFDGLERAAPSLVQNSRAGNLTSVATSDAELMEQFYAHTLADYVGAIVVPLIALVVIYLVHPILALTLLPFLLLVASVPVWLGSLSERQGTEVLYQLGLLNGETVEIIQGQREIAIFGRSRNFLEKLAAQTDKLNAAQRRYSFRMGLEHAAIDALTAATVLVVAWVGIDLILDGHLSASLLPVVLVLSAGALVPVVEVTQTARKLGELKAGAARILSIFHQRPQIEDRGTDKRPDATALQFDQVGFAYGKDRGRVLNDLRFDVGMGETVALVGGSGAGKSTTINLLLRFYDVAEGAIRIGGHDIRDLPISTLRQLIAYVPQDIHLFNESVADNIRLGRPDASPDEVKKAAELAQAHSFIEALPDGYNTLCGESGARLSGGQRQRIAIARALLIDAPILVLDEASSSLDTENDRAFRRALASIRGQKAVLLVAHRPSTIRSADRILVLEDGQIVEQGSHEELSAKAGVYTRLISKEENAA